jgi:hypothetical protein
LSCSSHIRSATRCARRTTRRSVCPSAAVDPSATVSLSRAVSQNGSSGHPQRASKQGTLPFARRGVAPGGQGRHEPHCVFGLEVAAKSADTCSW